VTLVPSVLLHGGLTSDLSCFFKSSSCLDRMVVQILKLPAKMQYQHIDVQGECADTLYGAQI
jgi:hypothetical protein